MKLYLHSSIDPIPLARMFYCPRDHLDMDRSVFGHHVGIAGKQSVILLIFHKKIRFFLFQLTNHMDKY